MRNCRKKDIQFNEYKIDYFFYFDLLSRTHLFLPSIYGRRPCYLVFFYFFWRFAYLFLHLLFFISLCLHFLCVLLSERKKIMGHVTRCRFLLESRLAIRSHAELRCLVNINNLFTFKTSNYLVGIDLDIPELGFFAYYGFTILLLI